MKHFISKRFTVIVSCLLLFISACANTQDDSSSSDSSNTVCLKLATDTANDIYASGYTSSDLNSDSNIGESDIFLIKYAPDGTQTWSKLLGTTSYDYMQGITTTTANDTLIAGYTEGALTGSSNSGGTDILLIKTAGDGTVTWEKQFGSAKNDYAYGIALDATGNIFVGGHTYGSYPGTGTTISGTKDLLLLKLDSSGTTIWADQLSNDEDDSHTAINGVYGIDVKTDAAGNIYVAGFTTGDLPGNTNAGGYDLFITKYDTTGSRLWVKQIGSAGHDYTRGLQVTTAGDLYLAGFTEGTLDGQTSAGESDLFLLKYDTDGNLQWIRQSGTDADDLANGIALDSGDNILLTGYTNGSLEGDNAGGSDLFIIEYDSTGTVTWTNQAGTSSTDLSRAIAIDGTDLIYLTGYTYGELDGESNSNDDYFSFVSRYTATGTQAWTDLF